MYLNSFADTAAPLDLASSDEFQSLLASAADLGIPHARNTAYSSRNIVLLLGSHQSAHSWDLVSLYLAQRHRVLALDQRGHGDSEWPRDVEYSNSAMSLDAEAFIAALGLHRPILMGHSMGGHNSSLLARRDPSRLRALVVIDVGPEVSDRGREVVAGFVQANQEFDDLEHFVSNVRK